MIERTDTHPEVREALARGAPVVALESTVVAHGLPWPVNLETARAMQEAVRGAGAVPAVVAITGGRIRIGLEDHEIERFASAADVAKASRRDIGILLAQGLDGAVTVAGTLACARAVGIEVFATGGIGGVHRGFESNHDVSADLAELARTPMAVVCSGAKSILDLPRTLEELETRGVPVVGYRTDRFPAFHVRRTELPVDARVDDVDAAAAMIDAHLALAATAILVVQPVPEAAGLQETEVETWIARALAEAREARVGGKAVTPFLLQRMEALSEGRSLDANRALLVANAALAGRVAVACAVRRS